MFRFLFPIVALALSSALVHADAPNNTLTDAEKAAGWKLLFDGTSTKGWRGTGKPEVAADWKAVDGELRLVRENGKTLHQDIITDEQFEDFELTWEWKIMPGGNSGLKYNLPDAKKGVGCEYQLLDDEKHPDGKLHEGTRTTGGLYDVLAPAADKHSKPAGEWNQSRIVVKGNHVEHYLNGAKTVSFDFGSEEFKAKVAQSKFKATQGWGVKTKSPILLQDHGDEVAFRNVKILAAAQ